MGSRPIDNKPVAAANKKRGIIKPLILILVLAALVILGPQLGVRQLLEDTKDWIRELGAWGPVAFVGIYMAATVGMAPGWILTVAAGALFGAFWGVVYTTFGAMLGLTAAFLIARYFARDAVGGWLSKSERFRRLDAMTEEHGYIIVAIVRLVPLFPFNFVNYAFGLTRVPFWTYVVWSLCILPGTIIYVVGTDAIVTGLREGRVPWVLVAVLLVMVTIVTLLVRSARAKLQRDKQPST